MFSTVKGQTENVPIAGSQRLPECERDRAGCATASQKQCRSAGLAPHGFCKAVAHSVHSALAVAMLLMVGCNGAMDDQKTDGHLRVFAGVPPVQYLVEQIGGEHVKVDSLVQLGQDPHTFEPSPQQVAALGRAAVFFKVNMPFEMVILEKVQEGNRRLAVVDATKGIQKLPFAASSCDGDNNDAHEVHCADELDPHVWLSPPLLKTIAANVAAGLCQADPAHREEYQRSLASLVGRLDRLHREVGRKLAPYRGRTFYVFHPGFAYFADAYGLKEEAVQVGGQAPSAKQLSALIAKARAEGVKTVFVQPEFDPQSAQVVADALGGRVVTINGLGTNVIADIDDIAMKIKKAMCRSSTQKDRRRE
jgi:zinc transport system substrate-binding protein